MGSGRAVLTTGAPASFQFPGFDSFTEFDQWELIQLSFEPCHGSLNPSSGGPRTVTRRPQTGH